MTRHRFLPMVAAVGLGWAAFGVQAGQALIPDQSEIKFVGKQMGVPSAGHFQKFTVDAALDQAAIEKSSARIVIDMNSITLPAPDFITEIKRKRWFDTASFPAATFEAKQFRTLGNGRYEVSGALTLKGVTREVTAPFTLTATEPGMIVEGQFELKRLDFNVGDGPWADTDTVANAVQVAFKLRLGPKL